MTQKEKILKILKQSTEGMNTHEISLATNIDDRSAASVLSRLVKDKIIKRIYKKESVRNQPFGKNFKTDVPYYFLKEIE